ncbi:MAG: hypothetical protein U9P44_01290 [archaeon]|nr:hypothetical protein [archaeon]
MKTYDLADEKFREISDLLEQGPGEGRYMILRDLLYSIAKDDFEEPGRDFSVQKKSEDIYEVTSGVFARMKLELDMFNRRLSVVEGKEK